MTKVARKLSSPSGTSTAVIILAAGLGKRMRSPLPKVLHEIGGHPLLFHVLDRIAEVSRQIPIAVVVGHGREQVENAIRSSRRYQDLKIDFVHQVQQNGTGHAARCVMDSEWGAEQVKKESRVLILPGDTPLIRAEMVQGLLAPFNQSSKLRLLTCEVSDPTGYGRVVRKGRTPTSAVQKIVEEKDATSKQKAIREIAVSIYSFSAKFLAESLKKISNRNAQGEYYLTDLIEMASKKGLIDVMTWADSQDLAGINDPWQLAQARHVLNQRTLKRWALSGVTILDPTTVWIDVDVEISEGVVIHPGAQLLGATRLAADVMVGPWTQLKRMTVGERVQLKQGCVCENSVIDADAQLGPYAHLRPDSHVGAKAKIGNFVELKKTRIGEATSVAHLSYLGDAEVGKNVNIGCGFVTCNFDGRIIDGQRKHRTIIEDDVFLGSDCQTIAPVKIGRGAYIASGSTITESVEPDALAIARSRQVNKPGYAKKLRQP